MADEKKYFLDKEGLELYDEKVKAALNKRPKVFVADTAPTSKMKKGDLWLKDTYLYFYNGSEWEQLANDDESVVVENYL